VGQVRLHLYPGRHDGGGTAADRGDPHGGCRLGGLQRLVAEVAAVAEADSSPRPPAAQERALALAQSVEPASFSSLHDDLVAGRRMELEALHGLVVRRAAEHGAPVPMSEAVYAILKPWALRNERPGT
jgi:2-dehydropantoate 2-reductase